MEWKNFTYKQMKNPITNKIKLKYITQILKYLHKKNQDKNLKRNKKKIKIKAVELLKLN